MSNSRASRLGFSLAKTLEKTLENKSRQPQAGGSTIPSPAAIGGNCSPGRHEGSADTRERKGTRFETAQPNPRHFLRSLYRCWGSDSGVGVSSRGEPVRRLVLRHRRLDVRARPWTVLHERVFGSPALPEHVLAILRRVCQCKLWMEGPSWRLEPIRSPRRRSNIYILQPRPLHQQLRDLQRVCQHLCSVAGQHGPRPNHDRGLTNL